MIADNLNKRVASLQARATLIYWTILFTLIGGVALVVFSGYLSEMDDPSNQAWRRLTAERTTLSTVGESGKKLYADHYEKLVQAEIANLTQDANRQKGWNWPSTVLRISIAGLLIFLVQILIQLYRYNSRLIAFYSSRRDSIIMAKGDFVTAEEWAEPFAPANLDFGKEPRHPFQEIAAFLGRRRPALEADDATPSAKPVKRRIGKSSSADVRFTLRSSDG